MLATRLFIQENIIIIIIIQRLQQDLLNIVSIFLVLNLKTKNIICVTKYNRKLSSRNCIKYKILNLLITNCI